MFELFYSTGGHVGPFPTLFEAKIAALRRLHGNVNERYIKIVHRKNNVVIGTMNQKHVDTFNNWVY